jgi:hypothetical protein
LIKDKYASGWGAIQIKLTGAAGPFILRFRPVSRIPMLRQMEASSMANTKAKANYSRRVLRLPDLDHSKSAVLNSLTSPGSRRIYRHAIEQFIAWYCSEPRLAFNRIVVVRYRMHLESN